MNEPHPFDVVQPGSITDLLARSKTSDALDYFREKDAPKPIAFPLPGGTVAGRRIDRWQVQPALFMATIRTHRPGESSIANIVRRAAEQITGFDEHGIQYVLTEDDIRAQTLRVGKGLTNAIKLFGDVSAGQRQPTLVDKDADGITKPIEVKLAAPVGGCHTISFHCGTLYEMELVASKSGDLETRFLDLMEVSSAPHSAEDLYPVDGWFLIASVLKPLQEKARKVLKAVRSYEYVMHVQFDRDLPLSILNSRMQDYGAAHDAKIKASKPQPGAKAKRRRR